MFKYLHKDPNRHSAYNMAVTFFRIGAFFLFISLIVVLYYFAAPKPKLTSDGIHSYTVTKLEKTTVRSHGRHTHTSYHYSLVCVDENGSTHNQKITESEYQRLEKGRTYTCPSYLVPDGSYFISFGIIRDTEKAADEYYKRNPTPTMVARKFLIPIPLILFAISVVIGIGELSREKKYLRDTEIIRKGLEAKIKDPEVDGNDFFYPYL